MQQYLKTILPIFDAHFKKLNYEKYPHNLYTPISHILSLNGKRIRPLISLCVYDFLGKKLDKNILHAATALELFHNFTLIHDDIIDQSTFRRGQITVHEKFGINAGILSGDALMILAYQQLDKLPQKYFPQILKTFNAVAIGICEGQQLDINFEKNENVNLDAYFKMIELKTSILLGLAFQISGMIADVNEANQKLLFEIGKNLGIAYQIQDDYLDVFGKFESFGKPIGNDIWLNKKTYLSIFAKQLANANQLQKLECYYNENTKENKINFITKIYKDIGLDIATKACISSYTKKIELALNNLTCLSLNAKNQILDFALNLVNREQ